MSRVAMLVIAAALMSVPTWKNDASAQSTDRAAQARREGTVVVYGTVPTDVIEGVMKLFEKTYGVHVEYWRAESAALTDRVLTESRAGKPQYDVVISSDTSMLILKDAKAFVPYYPSASFRFPAEFLDKDAILSPWRILPIGILYNSKLVKPEDVPKSYRDLLDPKWRGKLVLSDPSSHFTMANWLIEMQQVLGADWQSFVAGLAAQRPLLVESFIVVPRSLVTGEALVGIAYIKFVVDLSTQGAPIDYVRTKPILAQGNYIALGAKASHPNAAKLFIDYFLSKASLSELASHGEFVLFPGILPPLKDVKTLEFMQMRPMSQIEFRRWSSEFKGVFKR